MYVCPTRPRDKTSIYGMQNVIYGLSVDSVFVCVSGGGYGWGRDAGDKAMRCRRVKVEQRRTVYIMIIIL